MPKWAALGPASGAKVELEDDAPSVFQAYTDHYIGVVCPKCRRAAKLVRWGVLAKGAAQSGKLSMVFHCNQEVCDTEFSIDLMDQLGDAIFEHRPERISSKRR